MTLQTITPPVYIGPKYIRSNEATATLLDAAGEYVSWVIPAPKTGNIDRIHWYATTVTADGDGLIQRIETVSATDGLPSGTLVGGSSAITHVTTTANSWNRGTTGLAAAVTKGQLICAKLLSPPGTTFNGSIRSLMGGAKGPGIDPANITGQPYGVVNTGTPTKAAPSLMPFALEYDDGTTPYIEYAWPVSSIAAPTFNSTTDPDERGNLFQVPVPMRVVGVYHGLVPQGANQTADIVLYDSASTVLETISLDLDQWRTAAAGGSIAWFDTAITLSANTDYRIVIKPTVTSSMLVYNTVFDTTAGGTRLREMVTSGTTWQQTGRADAGAWTNTADSIVAIGLIADQFDDGAGSGGNANLFAGKF